MFKLTLNDGSIFQCLENSTMDMVNFKGTPSEVCELMGKFTTENLKNATIEMGDGIHNFINYVVTGGTFSEIDDNGETIATFTTREKTEMEIMQTRLDEQDAALMELAEMIGG